jgi:hypothetical protein
VFVHSWRVIYRANEREVRVVPICPGARLLKNVPPLQCVSVVPALNIPLPEGLKAFADERVAARG